MKYKVGDKVKIKTWEEMEKEFGLNEDGSIECDGYFYKHMENKIVQESLYRILTIAKNEGDRYSMIEIGKCCWSDDMIKCLGKEADSIGNRFEILDL